MTTEPLPDALAGLCDSKGFLADRNQWNTDIALAFARAEGITLTPDHWEIITLLQSYFDTYNDSPANRALVKYAKLKLGPEKGNSIYLMSLFPDSPTRRASRIAGLPKPKNCL